MLELDDGGGFFATAADFFGSVFLASGFLAGGVSSSSP